MLSCFSTLDTYGKTPEQMKEVVKMHLLLLGEYPFPLVKSAYLEWVKTQRKMPTPADIIEIVNRDNDTLLDYLEHYRIMRNYGGGLTQNAISFIEKKLGQDWKKYV